MQEENAAMNKLDLNTHLISTVVDMLRTNLLGGPRGPRPLVKEKKIGLPNPKKKKQNFFNGYIFLFLELCLPFPKT